MNLSRLMGWLQNKMPNLPINNFTTDWKDGRKVSQESPRRNLERERSAFAVIWTYSLNMVSK